MQNSQINTCARVSFFNEVAGLRSATLLKAETPTQPFCCEFFKMFKNVFFRENLQAAAADISQYRIYGSQISHDRFSALYYFYYKPFNRSFFSLEAICHSRAIFHVPLFENMTLKDNKFYQSNYLKFNESRYKQCGVTPHFSTGQNLFLVNIKKTQIFAKTIIDREK